MYLKTYILQVYQHSTDTIVYK